MPYVIDTHCHFADSAISGGDAIRQARQTGLIDALVLATHAADSSQTQSCARHFGLHYGIGVHPMLLTSPQQILPEIRSFEKTLELTIDDPLLAAVGEIGLDGFPQASFLTIPDQIQLFEAMLRAARNVELPVSIHSRKALPGVMNCLRKIPVRGVLHAFSGSLEQARQCLKLGLKLGFGPSLTYPGSKRIRNVFAHLPLDAFVLETDAPFMLTASRRTDVGSIGQPIDIFEVLDAAALVRGVPVETIAEASTQNALEIFDRLRCSLS